MINVSIIVPVFNVENHLSRAINSLIKQTHHNIEIIIINDGSTDSSPQICNEFEMADARIKVYHQRNKGVSAARNLGLQKSKGEYIYFFDSDDYAEPTLIEDNLKIGKKNNSELILFGHYVESEKGNIIKEICFSPSKNVINNENEFREIFPDIYFSAPSVPRVLWNKLYKRDYLLNNDCTFPPQSLGEDFLFNIDVYKNLSRVAINSNCYYHYVRRLGSAMNSHDDKRGEQELSLAKSFDKLISYWGCEHKYKELVMNEYVNVLRHEMNTLASKDSNLKLEEKHRKIENRISKDPILLSALEFTSKQPNRFKEKILFLFVKHKFYKTAIISLRLQMFSERLIKFK